MRYKSLKTPYFSVIGKSLDKVQKMFDEIFCGAFHLTDCICILSVFNGVISM